MLKKLVDQYRAAIGRSHYDLEWARIVDTFRLKYPTVGVITHFDYCHGKIPRAFLVWRRQNGDYEVDLRRSMKEVQETIALQRTIDKSLDGRNGSTMLREALEDVKYVGLGGLISWGIFDYSCRAGAGEFCADDLGVGRSFCVFVLREERHRFVRHI
ncbi:hypothetical protein [Cupriavidus sp. 8B]